VSGENIIRGADAAVGGGETQVGLSDVPEGTGVVAVISLFDDAGSSSGIISADAVCFALPGRRVCAMTVDCRDRTGWLSAIDRLRRASPIWALRPLYRAYENRLVRQIEGDPIPRHIGIILDGNRRHGARHGVHDPHAFGAHKLTSSTTCLIGAPNSACLGWRCGLPQSRRAATAIKPRYRSRRRPLRSCGGLLADA
jgi:hypothetical protein